jgi:hypothetical protein
LRRAGIKEVVEDEASEEPEKKTGKSEEGGLARAQIKGNWKKLTDADGVVRPTQQSVGIDRRALSHRKMNIGHGRLKRWR